MAQAQNTTRKVMIVAGEASGDIHAANLISALRKQDEHLEFLGAGGPAMIREGCRVLVPMEEISAMGFVEVLQHAWPISKGFKRLKRELFSSSPPDLLITIDFQEFNQKLAAKAQKAGVKVLHYVSPQVWAWRSGRVRKMARLFDKMAVILPFEPGYYQGQAIDVRYVGHPLLDDFSEPPGKDKLKTQLALNPKDSVLGLFPGSRVGEIRYNLPVLVETARLVREKNPDVRFLVPRAAHLPQEMFSATGSVPGLHLVSQNIYEVAKCCDAVLAVSGTVTLQVALVHTPMAIVYRMAPLTYEIAKRLVQVPYIGLPNIIADDSVVPEYIQHAATPAALAEEAHRLLYDESYRKQRIAALHCVTEKLGEGGSSERVADMALELLADEEKRNG